MAGVGRQVHDHLVQLGGIGHHPRAAIGQPAVDGDVGGQGRPEQVEHLGDHRGQGNRHELLVHLAAEGEDLPDQGAGPAGGVDDRPAVLGHDRVLTPLHLEQLRPAEDRRQQVVEIVGNAAGQAADGLEFPGLLELPLEFLVLLFEPLLLGQVDDGDEHLGPVPLVAGGHHRPPLDQERRALQGAVFRAGLAAAGPVEAGEFDRVAFTRVIGQGGGQPGEAVRLVGAVHRERCPVGMDDARLGSAQDQILRLGAEMGDQVTDAAGPQVVEPGLDRAQVLFHQRHGRVLEQEPVAGLGLGQGLGLGGDDALLALVEQHQGEHEQADHHQAEQRERVRRHGPVPWGAGPGAGREREQCGRAGPPEEGGACGRWRVVVARHGNGALQGGRNR